MRLIQTPVKRSREFEETIQKLGGKDATMFPTLREALTFCAVLGFKERRKKPLNGAIGTEDIAGAQYQFNDAVDLMFALALADAANSDILRPDREADCVKIYEEYANGGLELVQSWIDRHANIDVEDAVWRCLQSIGVKPNEKGSPPEVVVPDF
jgi:dnd system-associated protein 4